MANIQYIGARYVPKFYENPDDESNNWKAGVSYEPLTVVTYQDNSYTSKKPVPATVSDPASAPSYWVLTANYSAAIEGLQEEISDINNEIGDKSILTENTSINDALYRTFIKASLSPHLDTYNRYINDKQNFFDMISGETSSDYVNIQGCCYDSKRNYLVIICYGNGASIISRLNADTMQVIDHHKFTNNELGSGYNICYDQVNDRYVTLGGYNKIVIINNLLNIIDTITLSIVDTEKYLRGITYDLDRHVFYGFSNAQIYVFDELFNEQKYLVFPQYLYDMIHVYGANTSKSSNGITYHDDMLYINMWSLSPRTTGNYIFVLNMNLDVISIYNLSQFSYRYEIEDLTFIDDVLIIAGQSPHKINLQNCYFDNASNNDFNNMISGGVTLSAGDDLNTDAFLNGVYSYAKDDSSSISNAPFNEETTVYTFTTHNSTCQMAIGGLYAHATVAFRFWTGTWSAWDYREGCYIGLGSSKPIDGLFTGYIDTAGSIMISIPNIQLCAQSVESSAVISVNVCRVLMGSEVNCDSGTVTDIDTYESGLIIKLTPATPITGHNYESVSVRLKGTLST